MTTNDLIKLSNYYANMADIYAASTETNAVEKHRQFVILSAAIDREIEIRMESEVI